MKEQAFKMFDSSSNRKKYNGLKNHILLEISILDVFAFCILNGRI